MKHFAFSLIYRSLALFSTLIIGPALLAAEAPAAPGKQRPNILLIIGDDIGIDVTTNMYPGLIDSLLEQYGPSGHNHPRYKEIEGRPASTPTLAAFAKSGMRFTQAWVEPFCANTRSSILTGLYPATTGVTDYTGWLSQKQHSFVQDLKDKGGYSTAIFGKWHIAGLDGASVNSEISYPGMKPKEAGFDLFQGNLNGGIATYWDYDYHVQDSTSPASQWRTEKAPARSLPGIATTTFAPVVKVADTLAWIKQQNAQDPNKPWFAWLAFNLSHITGQQQPNPMAVPNIDTLDEASRKEMQACGGTFGSANVGNCSDKALMRAMTNTLDTLVAKLLTELDTIDPDAYVIYIGDNGTWMFGPKREFIDNMYLTSLDRGKGTAYESGARVEMAIRGPGIKPDSVSDALVDGVDFFATILDIAGIDVPKTVPNRDGSAMVPLDGISLTPILIKGVQSLRDANKDYLLTETTNPVKNNMKHVGARNANYKVICADGTQTEACEFYNLQNDPLEEYPLPKPESCNTYLSGKWLTSDPQWHFCMLQEAIAKKSFLAVKN